MTDLSGFVTIQVSGCPQIGAAEIGDRWNAAFVRFLLETEGSVQDWLELGHSRRIELAKAEPTPTEESRARVAEALARLAFAIEEAGVEI